MAIVVEKKDSRRCHTFWVYARVGVVRGLRIV